MDLHGWVCPCDFYDDWRKFFPSFGVGLRQWFIVVHFGDTFAAETVMPNLVLIQDSQFALETAKSAIVTAFHEFTVSAVASFAEGLIDGIFHPHSPRSLGCFQ